MTDRLDYELICSLVVLISQAAVSIERLKAVLVRCYLGARQRESLGLGGGIPLTPPPPGLLSLLEPGDVAR
jgi:hypothetical protein